MLKKENFILPRFITITNTSDIGPGERDIFEVEDLYIAVFNVGGIYYAIEDICTHDDGPLVEGDLDGFEIECPRHGARFDVRSGAVRQMPAVVPVKWFPVRVEGDAVQVGLDD
ncbi:MAG: non-heme iron oxygenase ferredoxin subunit [Chloroflexi bacterium]|nr:non-heme iron oxygenase ferredoxin subunit [Chloroflexota bacterium]